MNTRQLRRRIATPALLPLFALVTLSFFTACDRLVTTKIVDIRNHPRDYDGKLVTVAGEVSGGANVLIVKAFTLKDETGEILVITDRAVPKPETKMRVRGRVDIAFSIGGESLVVLHESSR